MRRLWHERAGNVKCPNAQYVDLADSSKQAIMVIFILITVVQGPIGTIIYFYDVVYFADPAYTSICIAAVISIFLPYFLNFIFMESKYLRIAIENYSDSLNLLVFDSIEKENLLELILKNGEVVVGFPVKSLNIGYKFVDLIPYAGGFYNLERNLTKVTSIYWVMENGKLPLEGGVEYSNYKVSVKAEEILLARNFNPEVYNYVFGELLQATEDS